ERHKTGQEVPETGSEHCAVSKVSSRYFRFPDAGEERQDPRSQNNKGISGYRLWDLHRLSSKFQILLPMQKQKEDLESQVFLSALQKRRSAGLNKRCRKRILPQMPESGN